jgi:uncharacterized protein
LLQPNNIWLRRGKLPFNLFRKKKQEQPQPQTVEQAPKEQAPTVEPEAEKPIETVAAEQPKQEASATHPEPAPQAAPIPQAEPKVGAEALSKMYLKAMPLRELSDLENVKKDIKDGNILILRVTPLASKSIEDVKKAVNELFEFTESIGGDIARLGEERVVICPKNVRIWREKKPAQSQPITNSSLPTAA